MINSTMDEMNFILRKKLSRKEYEEICFLYGIDLTGEGEYLNFELTSDRLELVSKYSLADLIASMRGFSVRRHGTVAYKKLDVSVKNTDRPFVNTLFVKLDEPIGGRIPELVGIQDKLDATIGRSRKNSAIGMFDYGKLSFPLVYKSVKPKDASFVPLGYNGEKTFRKILEETKQGEEYGKLITRDPSVWVQKDGSIVSLPPIVNADFASVTPDTKELFVDVTGMDRHAVNSVTKALIFNLQFFGSVSVVKPVYFSASLDTRLSLKQALFHINRDNISRILGIDLSLSKAAKMLERFGYEVKEEKDGSLAVLPPFYRQDVIHQVDIIDDIVRMYGVNNIPDTTLKTYTVGSRLQNSQSIDNIRDIMVGSGYQELELNVLTNESVQFAKTGIAATDYAPLLNIKSGEITMARANILPEMLRFLSNNLKKRLPQNLFDVGYVVRGADTDVLFENRLRLAIASCSKSSNVSDVIGVLRKVVSDTFGDSGLVVEEGGDAEGFSRMMIKGRAGTLKYNGMTVGVVGEVHPKTLNEFGIETPVSVAELYLDKFGL